MNNNDKINAFVDYMLDFYGPNGIYDFFNYKLTRDDVLHGLIAMLLETPNYKFEGDTIDRERLRDFILDRPVDRLGVRDE